ncbi:unnamed protein product [Protopolystoma xenopodis]|uniref:Uncharacterized protein n=1 Tax=Protopolystoma xenopodis TaxID=117903 RepID=A0A3S5B1E0_9PLAT|nr:unnamed protein product [Protopolystoma xenopodis]
MPRWLFNIIPVCRKDIISPFTESIFGNPDKESRDVPSSCYSFVLCCLSRPALRAFAPLDPHFAILPRFPPPRRHDNGIPSPDQETVTRGCLSNLLLNSMYRLDIPQVRRHGYCVNSRDNMQYWLQQGETGQINLAELVMGVEHDSAHDSKRFCFCNDWNGCNPASQFRRPAWPLYALASLGLSLAGLLPAFLYRQRWFPQMDFFVYRLRSSAIIFLIRCLVVMAARFCNFSRALDTYRSPSRPPPVCLLHHCNKTCKHLLPICLAPPSGLGRPREQACVLSRRPLFVHSPNVINA